LEQSPIFDGDNVRLVWRVYSQAGSSTEYARDGRLN
jgi:hypothetical protein